MKLHLRYIGIVFLVLDILCIAYVAISPMLPREYNAPTWAYYVDRILIRGLAVWVLALLIDHEIHEIKWSLDLYTRRKK